MVHQRMNKDIKNSQVQGKKTEAAYCRHKKKQGSNTAGVASVLSADLVLLSVLLHYVTLNADIRGSCKISKRRTPHT